MPVTGTPDQLRKGRGSSGFCLFSLRKIPCAYFLSMSVKPAPLSCFHNFSTGLLHLFAKNRGKPAQILRASGLFLFPGFALASLRRIKPADPPVFRRHLFNDDRGGRGIFPSTRTRRSVAPAISSFFCSTVGASCGPTWRYGFQAHHARALLLRTKPTSFPRKAPGRRRPRP